MIVVIHYGDVIADDHVVADRDIVDGAYAGSVPDAGIRTDDDGTLLKCIQHTVGKNIVA
jgi:hypothetical protein